MNKIATAQQVQTTDHFSHAKRQDRLQRKCDCGSHTPAGGECPACAAKKRIRLQRKLKIGASNDLLEREADRVADQVMAKPLNSGINATPLRIQRFSGQASDGLTTAPESVDRVLASSGRPLESRLLQDMESRFGYDFSKVRVHTGGLAEQSSREINAQAYTVSNNIVFSKGRFAPETQTGKQLLAHELTHTLQQSPAVIHRNGENVSGSQTVFDFALLIISGTFDSYEFPVALAAQEFTELQLRELKDRVLDLQTASDPMIDDAIEEINIHLSFYRDAGALPASEIEISAEGLEFITRFEGFRANLYNDSAGHCTIGIGHLLHRGNCNGTESAEFRAGITRERALEFLRDDARAAADAVQNEVTVDLTQAQFDALVSFTFNVGAGNFRSSTLLRELNSGNYDEVPNQLNRWNRAGVEISRGLANRRQAEGALFRDGVY